MGKTKFHSFFFSNSICFFTHLYKLQFFLGIWKGGGVEKFISARCIFLYNMKNVFINMQAHVILS